jgi:hypothetical protein
MTRIKIYDESSFFRGLIWEREKAPVGEREREKEKERKKKEKQESLPLTRMMTRIKIFDGRETAPVGETVWEPERESEPV